MKSAAGPKLHKIRSKIQPVWFDKECESLKAIKLKLLCIFHRYRSQDNLQNYLKARNSFKRVTDEKQNEYKENKIESSIDDSKSFWSKLKALTCKNNQIRNSKITKQEWVDHFEKLFSGTEADDTGIIDEIEIDEPNDEIEHLIFNESISDDEILHALST